MKIFAGQCVGKTKLARERKSEIVLNSFEMCS